MNSVKEQIYTTPLRRDLNNQFRLYTSPPNNEMTNHVEEKLGLLGFYCEVDELYYIVDSYIWKDKII